MSGTLGLLAVNKTTAAGGGSTTWGTSSGTDYGSNILLTNANLTVHPNGNFVSQGARSSVTGSAKIYWEAIFDGENGGGIPGAGFCDASGVVTGTQDNHSVYVKKDGTVVQGVSSAGTVNTYVVADRVCLAYDVPNRKLWVAILHSGSLGNWNNDVIGNQNPATGTGGITIGSTISNSAVYAYAFMSHQADQYTADFATSTRLPSGFVLLT